MPVTIGGGGGGGSTVIGRDPARLKYAPPAQVNPTVVDAATVKTSFYSGTFGPDEDVIFEWPTSARTSAFTVNGGRHVRIIGGKLTHGATGAGVKFNNVTGSVFIEGLDIDMGTVNNDAFDINGVGSGGLTYPDVYIQNCRVTNVNGTAATTHADIFQPQGPIGRLFVDKLSGRSNYQGFFLSHAYAITSAEFSRMDLAYEPGGDPVTYLLWLCGLDQQPFPVRFDSVYINPRSGQSIEDDAIFPSSGQVSTSGGVLPVGTDIGAVAISPGTVALSPRLLSSGVVISGTPPDGDYVPAGSVGLNYTSPGYAEQPAGPPVRVSASPGPRMNNLLGWTGDPANMVSQVALSKGYLYVAKIPVPEDVTIGSVGFYVAVAGSGTIANSFVGVVDSNGNTLGKSADISSSLLTAGFYTWPLTSPVYAAGGRDNWVYAALLLNGSGTMPQLLRGATISAASVNSGLTASDGFRFGQYSSGLSAIPDTVTMGSVTVQGNPFWMCIGA